MNPIWELRRTLLVQSASLMMSQLGTHYKGAILLFTSDCKTSEMEGEAKSKNRRRKLTLLCCRRPNKVSCKNHSNTPFHAHFHKGGKTKTKMEDLGQDSHTGLPTEYFALCSEHFDEASCFSRSVLIGTPVDFKRFCLEKGSVPSIYAKPKDLLDIDYPKNKGRLANRIFPEKRSLDVSLGPSPSLSRNVSIQNPPPKKIDFFSDWVGLFKICFRSSDMTDPQPRPRGWTYYRVPLRSMKICQVQTNNKLSTAKIDIF